MTTGHPPNPVKLLVDFAKAYDEALPNLQAVARTFSDAILTDIHHVGADVSASTLAVFAQGATAAHIGFGTDAPSAPPVVVLAVGALARRILDGEIDQ